MVNQQLPEKKDLSISIEVHSIFRTIQGEGPYAGYPAVFVRLAGCNIQCPQCDTQYTDTRRRYFAKEILNEVEKLRPQYSKPLVVITGGEPFRQPTGLARMVVYLLNAGWVVQIESNGTLPAPEFLDNRVGVVISPKTAKVHISLYPYIMAIKYVLTAGDISEEDGLPKHVLGYNQKGAQVWRPPQELSYLPVYVQPADDENQAENTKAAVASAMSHGYILCLQLHKILCME